MDVPIASRIVAAFRRRRENRAEREKRNPMLCEDRTVHSPAEGMRRVYRQMGLSEEEIAERLLCKYTKIIERKGNLDECDK